MDVDENFAEDTRGIEEIETKLSLLSTEKRYAEYIELIKNILGNLTNLDVTTAELTVLSRLLPELETCYSRILSDNYSLFQSSSDEVTVIMIKGNLEVIFEITEMVQEVLHYIYESSPVELLHIKSISTCLPKYLQLFSAHLKNSSDDYQSKFVDELSKVYQVMKHLFSSFLYLLESSLSVPENSDIRVLVDILKVLCDMPRSLNTIDPSAVISIWKCFSIVTNKYSAFLEGYLDINIPIIALSHDICHMLKTLPEDLASDKLKCKIKILMFLIKVLKNLTHIFYQHLEHFAVDLQMLFVNVFSYFLVHNQSELPQDILDTLQSDVFSNLEEFLGHLVTGQPKFKEILEFAFENVRSNASSDNTDLGLLYFFNLIFQIIAKDSSDWSGDVLIKLTRDVFRLLPNCSNVLFSNRNGIYQNLIVNLSRGILMHGANFSIAETLLSLILQEDVLGAVLAIEVYTLLASNISSEECLLLLTNLLYGVDEFSFGFFTHRPELVYLKILLQRLFKTLPDAHREKIIKLFPPTGHIQIWRLLGFRDVPLHLVNVILEPIIENTLEYIKSVNQSPTKDMPGNIAEGLDLISTVKDFKTIKNSSFFDLVTFMETFWSSDVDKETLNNNLMKYFVRKTITMTAKCLQESILKAQPVFTKLKLFLTNESYFIPVFKLVSLLLISFPLYKPDKCELLKLISDILPLALKISPLMEKCYLQLMKCLNEQQNDTLNMLLDNLNSHTASHIFNYIDQLKQLDQLTISDEYNFVIFEHRCVQWSESTRPAAKRIKMDFETNENKTRISSILPRSNHRPKTVHPKPLNQANYLDQDDSSASEVINSIKSEVKCLLKLCKTEKLTAKNVSDLKIVVNQISSLM